MHSGDHQDWAATGSRPITAWSAEDQFAQHLGRLLAERAISPRPGPGRAARPRPRAEREENPQERGDWSRRCGARPRPPTGAGARPRAARRRSSGGVDEAEVRALIPAVRDNVTAGDRLARLIDDALGPEAKAPGQRRP